MSILSRLLQHLKKLFQKQATDAYIQCDEKRPICTNCTNHDIECTFSIPSPPSESQSPLGLQETQHSRPKPARFQPHQYSNGGIKQAFRLLPCHSTPPDPDTNSHSSPSQSQSPLLLPAPSPITNPTSISLADLRLFHNYILNTHSTMRTSDPHDLWQNHLVQWSFSFPSLLHLLLALSALHMAHEHPALRSSYIAQADAHFTFGIRSVTAILNQLDSENCQQVYMAASLICFVYFGRGPREAEYLVFSSGGRAEWLVLMNGVKSIVERYHERIFTGVLEPLSSEKSGVGGGRIMPEDLKIELHENTVHLEAVRRFVERDNISASDAGPSTCEIYIAAVDELLLIMGEVYEVISAGVEGVGIMHLLMGWLYRRPEEIVRCLEEKEPHALVILGYWAVLLRFMESSWFMEGWARHVLLGVSRSLHSDYRAWIEWPLQRVGVVEEARAICSNKG